MELTEEMALDRLRLINWEFDESTQDSCYLLLNEYLRRMAFWTEIVGNYNKYPFYDVSERLFPNIRASRKAIDKLEEILKEKTISTKMANVCFSYLHWAVLSSTQTLNNYVLLPPYEPLIVMFERRGFFTTEHGYILIGWKHSKQIPHWKSYLPTKSPIVELNKETLDGIDKYGST